MVRIKNKHDLYPSEDRLIREICAQQGATTITVKRKKGGKEFDVEWKGRYPWAHDGLVPDYDNWGGWLPLAYIYWFADWRKIADMTDYPDMLKGVDIDWSAIRDSSEKKIWAIFHMLTPTIKKGYDKR